MPKHAEACLSNLKHAVSTLFWRRERYGSTSWSSVSVALPVPERASSRTSSPSARLSRHLFSGSHLLVEHICCFFSSASNCATLRLSCITSAS